MVERAETAAAAIDACRGRRADVLVLDLDLPDDDGFHVLTELGAERPAAVLMLADRADGDLVLRALQLGAGGFVTKADGLRDLAETIRRVVAGERAMSPTLERDASVRWAIWLVEREKEPMSRPASPGASGRCSNSWAKASRSDRSRRSSASRRAPSRPTWRSSTASSGCEPACRRSLEPPRSGWWTCSLGHQKGERDDDERRQPEVGLPAWRGRG